MSKPVILLSNDDGIASPGLLAAAEALLPLGRLLIAAPARQQTSMGKALAGEAGAKFEAYPLSVKGQNIEAYTLDASPASVVRHMLLTMPHLRPDLVVSGINYGENIGVNVTGSGTVGATLEAASLGFPALAMSLETSVDSHRNYTEQDWSGSVYFTRFFAERILRQGLPAGATVIKVEVPSDATEKTPWRATRLSPFPYYQYMMEKEGLANALGDLACYKRDGVGEPSDTDAYAIRTARAVAVTPLCHDLTAQTPLTVLANWCQN